MKVSRWVHLLPISLLVYAIPAHANMGTPLMWGTLLHLYIGNAFIGILEGLILAKLGGFGKTKSILTMIAANYVSALWGFNTLGIVAEQLKSVFLSEDPLMGVRYYFYSLIAVAIFLTPVFEYPFVLFLCWNRPRKWIRSIGLCLLAQAISYAILIPYYSWATSTTLMTELDPVPISEMERPRDVSIYYLTPNCAEVHRFDLGKLSDHEVFKLDIWEPNQTFLHIELPRLLARVNGELIDILLQKDYRDEEGMLVLSGLKGECVETPLFPTYGHDFTDFRNPDDRTWTFHGPHSWAVEGIKGFNKETEERVWYGLEIPYIDWYPCNGTILEGDRIVFQLEDMICLLDFPKKRIARICQGRGPVVIREIQRDSFPSATHPQS
ncbi:MAG: hypothetical protein H6751_04105 [Candidatus Omnitrophica bacterium]|nr:hypothetical protein [Candidatus Omnitrophota bacterium]